MTKGNLVGTLIFGSLIGIIGFVMLFNSVNFGTSLAEKWLIKEGGADPNTYNIILKSYINNYLVGGSILFSFGLLIDTLAYFKMQIIKVKLIDV
ncbi:hypothetical protein [Bacillus sp. 03113]|uniref:hypothetical protein n=1 Tax=Bacillus sp. 03113 TaxID=2578211 RepID=UPI001143B95E|nr:hypothetical protein [Bacillus sp. 03113]